MRRNIKTEIINSGGINHYLYAQQYKCLLRFLTCGSVDDGKSTLIGRLLYDAGQVNDDQLSALYLDSKKIGTQKNKLDLALLIDGLQLEREQGITIDVAYRYFYTQKRKFIIADTPGHEEYTRNMATGASTSDLAVLLIDARKGLRTQTLRHWLIIALLGIRYIVVVVNKMDLVHYNRKIFQDICNECLKLPKKLINACNIQFIPISSIDGDNITMPSINMKWYSGPTLLHILENINIKPIVQIDKQELRFPIQYVIRNGLDFRGYAGTVASGIIRIGQHVKIFPSGSTSIVKRIITFQKDQEYAIPGESIILTVEHDVDLSRGDIVIESDSTVIPVQSALVDVIWMSIEELKKGRYFNVKIATKIFRVQVEKIQYQVDTNTLTFRKTNTIPINGIGRIKLLFDELLILDKYYYYPITGSMIFIDLLTNETVGAGMVCVPITSSKSVGINNYSAFELELHSLIRYHFPHWNIRDLL